MIKPVSGQGTRRCAPFPETRQLPRELVSGDPSIYWKAGEGTSAGLKTRGLPGGSGAMTKMPSG